MMYQNTAMMPMQNQMQQQMARQQQNGFMNQNGMGVPNNASMQSQFNQPQQTNFFAKIVDSIEAVRIADVPMDGNSYIFPKADGSEIYTKRWLPNFTTDVSVYVKAIPEEMISMKEEKVGYSNAVAKEDFEDMSEKLFDKLSAMMNDRLDKIEKSIPTQQSSSSRQKS